MTQQDYDQFTQDFAEFMGREALRNLSTVSAAVAARLDRQTFTVAVACVSSLNETAKPCASAAPDVDRIKVTVSWTRSPLTPVTAA